MFTKLEKLLLISQKFSATLLVLTLQIGPVWAQMIENTCVPPVNSDWIITESCILAQDAVAPQDVIISPQVVLTIPAPLTLSIDLQKYKLWVQEGGAISLQAGATLQSVTSSPVLPPAYDFAHLEQALSDKTYISNTIILESSQTISVSGAAYSTKFLSHL